MPLAAGSGEAAATGGALVVVHTSDLHLGSDHRRADLRGLEEVTAAARAVDADVLLLAGDVFDHNRLPLAVVDAAARLLADLELRVVILPGNHDPLTPNSVYRRGGLAEPANVDVLGLSVEDALCLEDLELEIWGRPHHDHEDMAPLAGAPTRRRMRRHISVAHGHWVTGPHDRHRSWLLHDGEIARLDTDYLALGHWDRAVIVSEAPVRAYYSGSPELARTVNVVRFTADGELSVARYPLGIAGV